ncbi:hypothetical protein ACFOKJ_15355 [Vogesella amnigena]|uniref:Uncharacterized protein n=1 Tax=Vogesella amnigena TaxID=1507449 RepID=A0ABV7TXL6_9NEIS
MKEIAEKIIELIKGAFPEVLDSKIIVTKLKCRIFSNFISSVESIKICDGVVEDLPVGRMVFKLEELFLRIRDCIMNEGGCRIWGLTFTLYPGGKYEIEYDYNKPADYEDTEDTISGDEINQSLGGLLATEPLPMQMTAEQAYQAIGQCVFQAQDEAGWHLAGVDLTYQPGRQVRMHFWQETAAGKQRAPKVPDHAAMVAAADGAYALYDSLTSQGGVAPDGLSFTLTPEGRMKLDYRYPDA